MSLRLAILRFNALRSIMISCPRALQSLIFRHTILRRFFKIFASAMRTCVLILANILTFDTLLKLICAICNLFVDLSAYAKRRAAQPFFQPKVIVKSLLQIIKQRALHKKCRKKQRKKQSRNKPKHLKSCVDEIWNSAWHQRENQREDHAEHESFR